ncbi:MAG: GntR family transcriptional regulator [Alphaproteobacteria bacterium]|nr:GntR family transcriptional regulator [Alphaproteobacteria bacterium]
MAGVRRNVPNAASSGLQAQAYSVLLDVVSDGTLKAGRALDVDLLADRTGLPSSIIDAALERLASHGFVERAAGQRYVVAACTRDEARRVLVRQGDIDAAAFEDPVVPLGNDRRVIGLAIVAQGREALSVGSLPRLAEADLAFHRMLADVAAGPDADRDDVEHWTRLRRVASEWWAHASATQAARAWEEHAAILEALSRGATGDGAQLVRRHVVSSIEAVSRFDAT